MACFHALYRKTGRSKRKEYKKENQHRSKQRTTTLHQVHILVKQHETEGEEHYNPTPTAKDFDNDTKNCPLAVLSLFTASSSSAQTLRELTEKIEQTGMRNLEEGDSHGSASNNNEIEQEGGIKPAD